MATQPLVPAVTFGDSDMVMTLDREHCYYRTVSVDSRIVLVVGLVLTAMAAAKDVWDKSPDHLHESNVDLILGFGVPLALLAQCIRPDLLTYSVRTSLFIDFVKAIEQGKVERFVQFKERGTDYEALLALGSLYEEREIGYGVMKVNRRDPRTVSEHIYAQYLAFPQVDFETYEGMVLILMDPMGKWDARIFFMTKLPSIAHPQLRRVTEDHFRSTSTLVTPLIDRGRSDGYSLYYLREEGSEYPATFNQGHIDEICEMGRIAKIFKLKEHTS